MAAGKRSRRGQREGVETGPVRLPPRWLEERRFSVAEILLVR